MEYTGADGVMSAEGLLDDPGLFEASRLDPGGAHSPMHGLALAREYLHWAGQHPAPMRMVKVGRCRAAGLLCVQDTSLVVHLVCSQAT
jgi:hypothetical protein